MSDKDLQGRHMLITGATAGIGRAAAGALAERGADLVLLCRDPRKGEATAAELRAAGAGSAEVLLCDLASQDSIRSACARFLARDRPLHALLNNAGVFWTRRTRTPDGLEATFATNHLGYFLVTNLLLDRLRESAPARVISVASDAHRFARSGLPWDDLQSESGYRAMRVYGESKLANILFTRELARRTADADIRVACLHPGGVSTELGKNNGWLGRAIHFVAKPFFRTPEQGADTLVWLATCPDAELAGEGVYWADRRRRTPSPAARSDEDAARLWEISERLTGLSKS